MSDIPKLDMYELFWEQAENASAVELSKEETLELQNADIPYSANPIIANINILKWRHQRELKNLAAQKQKIIDNLTQELKLADSIYNLAIKERNYERLLNNK